MIELTRDEAEKLYRYLLGDIEKDNPQMPNKIQEKNEAYAVLKKIKSYLDNKHESHS